MGRYRSSRKFKKKFSFFKKKKYLDRLGKNKNFIFFLIVYPIVPCVAVAPHGKDSEIFFMAYPVYFIDSQDKI